MEMIIYSYANPSLVLKVSEYGTQKWPIGSEITRHLINQSELYGISAHDARLMHLVRVLIGWLYALWHMTGQTFGQFPVV